MKKSLIATTLITGMALSSTVFAADGVIHFTGKVLDNVCNVSPTLNVNMDDVSVDTLGVVGDRVKPKDFVLTLTDCPASLTTAKIQLDGTADSSDLDIFQLDNAGQPGVASGIGLEIISEFGAVIVPGGTTDPWALNTITGTNTLPFKASYKRTNDTVTAGDANVSVQFSVLYN
ncbi:MAG: fimbrial protein [Chania sp.]